MHVVAEATGPRDCMRQRDQTMQASPIGSGKGSLPRSAPASHPSRAPSGHGDDGEPRPGTAAASIQQWERSIAQEMAPRWRSDQVLTNLVLAGSGGLSDPPGLSGVHPEATGSRVPGPEMVSSSQGSVTRTGGILVADGSAQTDDDLEQYMPTTVSKLSSTAAVAGMRVLGPEMVTSSLDSAAQTGDNAANQGTLAERTPVGDSEELASNRGSLRLESAPAASAADRSRSAKEPPTGSASGKSDSRRQETQMVASSAVSAAGRSTSQRAAPADQSPQTNLAGNLQFVTRTTLPAY